MGTDIGPGLRNQPCKAVFTLEKPIAHPKGSVIVVWLSENHGGVRSDNNRSLNLGRLRLSVTSAREAVADPVPIKVREILSVPRDQRTPQQASLVFSYWRTTVPEWKEATARHAHPDERRFPEAWPRSRWRSPRFPAPDGQG